MALSSITSHFGRLLEVPANLEIIVAAYLLGSMVETIVL